MWNESVMPPDSKLLFNMDEKGRKSYEKLEAPYYDSGDILYYYDGPVSFLTEFSKQKVLVTKINETSNFDERWEVWAAIVLSDEDIRSLKANEKPFVQYWLNRPNFIIETRPLPDSGSTDYEWKTQRIWKDVVWHHSWLPEKDVKLYQE